MNDFVNVRLPRTEYDKLKKAREMLSKQTNYSWVEHLSLGAFIGLITDLAMKKYGRRPRVEHPRSFTPSPIGNLPKKRK